ncbi:MAG TPA: hypothetical protein VKQ30_20845 [Ktedonobacterales bacterium]|nr:hypothetical protein [Ktedonobacterales bacterium]
MSSASQHVVVQQQVDGNLNPSADYGVSKFVPINAVTITSETAVWTPAAGKKFRLRGVVLSSHTAAGPIIVRDGTGGTIIAVIPNNAVDSAFEIVFRGTGILSAAANNALTFTGASTEVINGFVYGDEE